MSSFVSLRPWLLGAGCLLAACRPDSASSDQSGAAPPAATVAPAANPPAADSAGATAPSPAATAADGVRLVDVTAADRGQEALGSFVLPQVQLPDAAVAARLNQALVAAAFPYEPELQALAAPAAVQRCLRQYLADDRSGFTGLSYAVTYNQHGLLSLAFSSEYLGAYPSTSLHHAVFDTRTGRALRLPELLRPADTTTLRRQWRAAISRNVAVRLRTLPTDFPEEPDLTADLAARFRWNAATRQVEFEGSEPRFNDFALTGQGLVLYYSFGLPHVIQAAEPEGSYPFAWAELRPLLRPDGPLTPLLR